MPRNMSFMINILRKWALKKIKNTEPDQIIRNGFGNPYLRRWKVIRWYKIFNVFVHEFVGNDDNRDMHDHPWPSLSIMVQGHMWEDTPDRLQTAIVNGHIKYRPAKYIHNLSVGKANDLPPVTIFITGPKTREWGFHTSKGWINHKKYFGF